jgi:hypothetical protein
MAEILSTNGGRTGYGDDQAQAVREVLAREPKMDSPGWTAWRQELSNVIREEGRRYKIVRMYARGRKRTILSGLTLAEARAHCKDPETSSSTCSKSAGLARTRRMGEWFDGYDVER